MDTLEKNSFFFFAQGNCSLVKKREDVQWWAYEQLKMWTEEDWAAVGENDVYSFQDKNEMWPKKLLSN